jgi:uncharacterized C2H2 Zn-finger protein
MGYCCSICLDAHDELPFTCGTRDCPYGMCHACVKLAFEDSAGQNSRFCPSCKAPTARRMVESMCGKGAVRQVEQELRENVEFEVKKTLFDREKGKQEMGEMKDRARKLFLDLSERLNMQCPRCNMVFDDFEGCNALVCSNMTCRAAICAICLKDCGHDAHEHVRRSHGDLFDKSQFKRAKQEREGRTLCLFLDEIKDEPFEVHQLVKVEFEKLSGASKSGGQTTHGAENFLISAKENLASAVKTDRLSVLSDAERRMGLNRIQHDDISPRCAIPADFKLTLSSRRFHSKVCQIKVQQRTERGVWQVITLPEEDDATFQLGTGPKVDALMNVKRSLQCGIVAFEGATSLYQTMRVTPNEKQELRQDEISVIFRAIDSSSGELEDHEAALDEIRCDDREIIGINQNLRLVLLERHVEKTDRNVLLFDPLRNFVGSGTPSRVFSEIPVPAPASFENLNTEQKHIAHPLTLTSAMEAAGPPGTGKRCIVSDVLCLRSNFVSDLLPSVDCLGKTKTITELVRGIIQCTEHEVIVLSERNGAIEAIAEKIADDCLDFSRSNKDPRVIDVGLWMNVLAFGSAGGMGESTKRFTVEQKKRYESYGKFLNA